METTMLQDIEKKINGIYHQHMLMLRDPLIYLAINEDIGGFSKEEKLAIKMAKMSGMVAAVKPKEALEYAKELDSQIDEQNDPEIALLYKLITAGAYVALGDATTLSALVQEALFLSQRSRIPHIKLHIEGLKILLSHKALNDVHDEIEALAHRIDEADHPYVRYSLLNRTGILHARNQRYDLALDYFSLAYEITESNQLCAASIEIALWILMCSAELKKVELGEQFYAIGESLVSRLRINAFDFAFQYHYGKLKMAQEDYHAAVLFFQKSIASYQDYPQLAPSIYIETLRSIATSLNKLDSPEAALPYLMQAEELIKDQGLIEKEMNLNLDIAVSLVQLDRWEEAIVRLEEAAEFYRKHQKSDRFLTAGRLIARYHSMQGESGRAYEIMQEIDELNTQIILEIKQAHSRLSEEKLINITRESREVKAKYEKLVKEMSRRTYERFSGKSEAARRVVDAATLAAMQNNSNVFLSGENGVGKKIVAQMIHYGSENSAGDFYSMNCAALSEKELEARFFGKPGAKSDDEKDYHGYFALAQGGTLYIDEISALPMEFQAVLAEVLGCGYYQSGYSGGKEKITCRIISSSSVNMLYLVRAKKFNLNLLNKLSTLEISIPALRERKEDIPQLVENFVRNISWEHSKSMPKIEHSFYTRLNSYEFPGNISELKNIIEQLFILYYKPVWNSDILENITAFKQGKSVPHSLLEHDIEELDRDRIMEALRKTGGKQKHAARLLNMSESTLCRRIQKYGLKR